MRVVHPGRSFISYLISLSTTVQDLNHFVTLNSDCCLDLHMWHKFLSQWNGTSFFLDDDITNAADMHLYTDATDSAFGGYYSGKWFQGQFPSEILLTNEKPSMAF